MRCSSAVQRDVRIIVPVSNKIHSRMLANCADALCRQLWPLIMGRLSRATIRVRSSIDFTSPTPTSAVNSIRTINTFATFYFVFSAGLFSRLPIVLTSRSPVFNLFRVRFRDYALTVLNISRRPLRRVTTEHSHSP